LLAFGTGLLSPVVGKGVGLICDVSSKTPQVEKDATNPDLQLRLASGVTKHFESYVERDATSHVFGYQFVVPVAAIPPDGLRLEILDSDGADPAETMGVFRLYSQTLASAFSAPGGVTRLSDGAVRNVELVVSTYVPASITAKTFAASEGPRALGIRPVIAGEIVSLRMRGDYTIGTWAYTSHIGPQGYPGNEGQGYNFAQEPFATALHACGIALIDSPRKVEGVVVGSARDFVISTSGTLRAGLNDRDPSNNNGWVSVEGATRAPTVLEWSGG